MTTPTVIILTLAYIAILTGIVVFVAYCAKPSIEDKLNSL